MCGIVAIWSPEEPVPAGAVDRATDALAHRGPDGRGTWIGPDGRVALGHTRLVLVDPLADQPLASEDGSLRLVVNGELYDDEAVRAQLAARGHRLATRSDSEVALHLYEELGAECVEALRGEFAFVLWDGTRRRLLAARDRFGIKPLFYAQMDGALYLASEIKALVAAGVPAAWDEESVYDQLHLCLDPSRTLFRGIRQVPPAHRLLASGEGIRLERYWDIPYPRRSEVRAEPGADEERKTIDRVRVLLDDAVRVRLRGDVPVGCLLSGGVDSSTVLALAARHSNRPVSAFTIAFDRPPFDETDAARVAAAHAGADLHVLPVADRELADAFPDAVCQGEGIQLNGHGPARYLLSRAIHRAGFKAVMAGEGADEAFMGYAFVRGALDRGGILRRIPAPIAFGLRLLRPPSAAQRRLADVSPWLARLGRGAGVAGPALDTLVERIGVMRGVLAADFLSANRHRDPYRLIADRLDARSRLRDWEPAKAMLYVWLRTLFPNYHMGADRLDMAHAVEVRLPFLDHPLFEEVARIPVSLLARDGHNKHLLREAARPWLPSAAYRRVKQPFLAPPAAATLGTPMNHLVQDTLRSASLPFVDRAAVARLLDGLPARPPGELPAIEALLLALVSLEVLDARYVRA